MKNKLSKILSLGMSLILSISSVGLVKASDPKVSKYQGSTLPEPYLLHALQFFKNREDVQNFTLVNSKLQDVAYMSFVCPIVNPTEKDLALFPNTQTIILDLGEYGFEVKWESGLKELCEKEKIESIWLYTKANFLYSGLLGKNPLLNKNLKIKITKLKIWDGSALCFSPVPKMIDFLKLDTPRLTNLIIEIADQFFCNSHKFFSEKTSNLKAFVEELPKSIQTTLIMVDSVDRECVNSIKKSLKETKNDDNYSNIEVKCRDASKDELVCKAYKENKSLCKFCRYANISGRFNICDPSLYPDLIKRTPLSIEEYIEWSEHALLTFYLKIGSPMHQYLGEALKDKENIEINLIKEKK